MVSNVTQTPKVEEVQFDIIQEIISRKEGKGQNKGSIK